jgi:hypothetical protein
LLDLQAEFASLTNSLDCRAEMGRPSPRFLLAGLGTAGAGLIDIHSANYADHNAGYSYLAIDSGNSVSTNEPGGVRRLKLSASAPTGGTFCGIGEATMKSDPHLITVLRKAGIGHTDREQEIFLLAGIGGGIGSTASVLVEKCRHLNPICHIIALIIVPGPDESFHNNLNAYYGLSRLLDNNKSPAPDLIIAVRYDRMKTLTGVAFDGQELIAGGLLAAFTNLLLRNLPPQYISDMVRINSSLGVKMVVPCLAIGRSLEIFGSLANILESAIAYPANRFCGPAALVCHLLLRIPGSRADSFQEEAANEQLRALVRRHLPNVKATSTSITCSDEQHDRIEACLLLGGDSATSALFADDVKLQAFREETEKEIGWAPYGLNQESINQASKSIREYDEGLAQFRKNQKIRKDKVKRDRR